MHNRGVAITLADARWIDGCDRVREKLKLEQPPDNEKTALKKAVCSK